VPENKSHDDPVAVVLVENFKSSIKLLLSWSTKTAVH